MLELWIRDYHILKSIAISESVEVIPEELIEKMQSLDFARGTHIHNQKFNAAMPLKYYQTKSQKQDLDRIMIDMQGRYSLFAYV